MNGIGYHDAHNPEYWKASNPQKQEIAELLERLGWKIEDYGGGLTWENMLWHQAISIISGANWCLENPKLWTKS